MSHTANCNHSYRKNANYNYKDLCNHCYMDTIGRKIRELRTQRGLTPEQLAKNVGVSRIAVLKWENGSAQNIKIANILKICDIFGLTADELLRDTPVNDYAVHEDEEPYRIVKRWPFSFPEEKFKMLPPDEVEEINSYIEHRFAKWTSKSKKKQNAG